MILALGDKKPNIHKSAYVAPNATVCGDVTVEEGCAILFGAVLSAEGAPLVLGANTVVMENAVLKSSGGAALQFPLSVGESCIIGPGAFLSGCTVEPGAFIAAGSTIYNNARIGAEATVAQGALVHAGSNLPARASVPMAHIAFGDPAEIVPPQDARRAVSALTFSEDVFNVPKGPAAAAHIAEAYAKFLRRMHESERNVERSGDGGKKAAPKGKAAGGGRDEPPPQQTADVGKVLDVTFYELEEARMRREAALKRDPKKP